MWYLWYITVQPPDTRICGVTPWTTGLQVRVTTVVAKVIHGDVWEHLNVSKSVSVGALAVPPLARSTGMSGVDIPYVVSTKGAQSTLSPWIKHSWYI